MFPVFLALFCVMGRDALSARRGEYGVVHANNTQLLQNLCENESHAADSQASERPANFHYGLHSDPGGKGAVREIMR
jgi:hypothetical protein